MDETRKSNQRRRVLAGLVACIVLFVVLALLAGTDAGRQLNAAIFGILQPPAGAYRLVELLRDLTALGSLSVLGAATLIGTGWMVVRGMERTACVVLVMVIGGVGLSFLLKLLFSQPRPDVGEGLSMVFTSSFPSSHAMGALVTFVTLAWVGAQSVPDRRSSVYLVGAALCVSLVAGASRIGLGVHWPGDVIAGWLAGAAWLLLAWLLLARYGGILTREQDTRGSIRRSPQ